MCGYTLLICIDVRTLHELGISRTAIPFCRIVHDPAALRHATIFHLLARFHNWFLDRNALNSPFSDLLRGTLNWYSCWIIFRNILRFKALLGEITSVAPHHHSYVPTSDLVARSKSRVVSPLAVHLPTIHWGNFHGGILRWRYWCGITEIWCYRKKICKLRNIKEVFSCTAYTSKYRELHLYIFQGHTSHRLGINHTG